MIVDFEDSVHTFLFGLLMGATLTIFVWICVASQVEMYKVRAGYLTYRSKTYNVTLYDTLDKPVKENKDDSDK